LVDPALKARPYPRQRAQRPIKEPIKERMPASATWRADQFSVSQKET